mgnify:FL=1|tara:strand:+ start:1340 stop:2236 length:897 start_codon:yes stop_codon:yes gene_type:complete
MKYTNVHNLPLEIIRAVSNDSYTKGRSTISVTGLLQPPRIRILREECADQISVDISSEVWKLLGTSVHAILEKANEASNDTITEVRNYALINGWTISGQTDSISIKEKTLKDYKVTSSWSVMSAKNEGKIEWEQQLNCYDWLHRQNDSKNIINSLEIITINRDWSKNQMLRSGDDYPKAPVSVIPIRKWSDEEQKKFINDRVKLHQDAEAEFLVNGELPLCTDAEIWKRSDSFRVMKKGRKSAVRVLDSQELADSYIKEHKEKDKLTVEFLKGEPIRCKDYCDVNNFCSQYKQSEEEK